MKRIRAEVIRVYDGELLPNSSWIVGKPKVEIVKQGLRKVSANKLNHLQNRVDKRSHRCTSEGKISFCLKKLMAAPGDVAALVTACSNSSGVR